ncbi:hypothetical protein PMZ80_006554 [Knufia obscura]|uniref:A-kinase anchor protein 7-like phosphoesterase domain-containing protein n=2 Tax=Knufia TaxID=430999 RepID=A0AAN8EBC7_9EURO|nr:hypothetical protein PMZ80_006554 [Knufia obscura]KAK5950913.1 hypothetical protein OHC33_007985 [Knufia fluminis]
MAKGKKSKNDGNAEAGEKKAKTTHFLCFPLASETTVSQLAESLAYFRSVSTEPEKPKRRLEETPDGKVKVVTGKAGSTSKSKQPDNGDNTPFSPNEDDPLGNTNKPTGDKRAFEKSLQILPSIVHRAAGTYHLTLGVMDLSEESQMQKAKGLLQGLDLQRILTDAEAGPPAGVKQARKWQDKEEKETGEVEDEVSAKVEIGDDKPPETDPTRGVKSLGRPVSPPPLAATKTSAETQVPSSTPSPPPLYVSLTGLGAFPKEKGARVIWAGPREQSTISDNSSTRPTFNENTRLYTFGLHLREIFRKEGFITETRPLVLHATVANMRYKMQAKGGRTTKGRKWAHGKRRWQEGVVDARPLLRVFNQFDGDVAEAEHALVGAADEEQDDASDEERDENEIAQKQDDRDQPASSAEREYIWLRDAVIDRVAICKMGATEAEDPAWRYWYPPVSEKAIFDT